jgi:hypothetical protein
MVKAPTQTIPFFSQNRGSMSNEEFHAAFNPEPENKEPLTGADDEICYVECNGSLDGRNLLIDGFEYIDCTGGKAAVECTSLLEFGDTLVERCRANPGLKLFWVCRMRYPGMGLCITRNEIITGIELGYIIPYEIPEDLRAIRGERWTAS